MLLAPKMLKNSFSGGYHKSQEINCGWFNYLVSQPIFPPPIPYTRFGIRVTQQNNPNIENSIIMSSRSATFGLEDRV
jgi:hypothetical protein